MASTWRSRLCVCSNHTQQILCALHQLIHILQIPSAQHRLIHMLQILPSWLGPMTANARIEPKAVRLRILGYWRMHNVFNVSVLKALA